MKKINQSGSIIIFSLLFIIFLGITFTYISLFRKTPPSNTTIQSQYSQKVKTPEKSSYPIKTKEPLSRKQYDFTNIASKSYQQIVITNQKLKISIPNEASFNIIAVLQQRSKI